jgi:hypothetical protein
MTATQKLAIGLGVIGGALVLYFLTRKPSPTGNIWGIVVDETGDRLSGVRVQCVSERWQGEVYTDAGAFVLNDIPTGEYTVSFIKTGYSTPDRTVTVTTPYAIGLGTIVMYYVGSA